MLIIFLPCCSFSLRAGRFPSILVLFRHAGRFSSVLVIFLPCLSLSFHARACRSAVLVILPFDFFRRASHSAIRSASPSAMCVFRLVHMAHETGILYRPLQKMNLVISLKYTKTHTIFYGFCKWLYIKNVSFSWTKCKQLINACTVFRTFFERNVDQLLSLSFHKLSYDACCPFTEVYPFAGCPLIDYLTGCCTFGNKMQYRCERWQP